MNRKFIVAFILSLAIILSGCYQDTDSGSTTDIGEDKIAEEKAEIPSQNNEDETAIEESLPVKVTKTSTIAIPKYTGKPYVVLNHNKPQFSKGDFTLKSYEKYSNLDSRGRCGVAIANIGKDIMPTQKRGGIGQIKPTGWKTIKYDSVDGKYLYNRCHLIGYQLSGENANEKNLITGTRAFNVDGMLPFENMVADYVKETGNHVLYRVAPVYKGNNLIASGVQIEARSVEDQGDGILFNVYVYNKQPGITIDYETGESSGNGKIVYSSTVSKKTSSGGKAMFVLNISTRKIHKKTCGSISTMSEKNKKTSYSSVKSLQAQGYEPCKRCNP